MKRFQFSQDLKDGICEALGRFGGKADSPRIREALEEGRYELVEAYLRSGATRPTQYQDQHEMQALLRSCMNERELATVSS